MTAKYVIAGSKEVSDLVHNFEAGSTLKIKEGKFISEHKQYVEIRDWASDSMYFSTKREARKAFERLTSIINNERGKLGQAIYFDFGIYSIDGSPVS